MSQKARPGHRWLAGWMPFRGVWAAERPRRGRTVAPWGSGVGATGHPAEPRERPRGLSGPLGAGSLPASTQWLWQVVRGIGASRWVPPTAVGGAELHHRLFWNLMKASRCFLPLPHTADSSIHRFSGVNVPASWYKANLDRRVPICCRNAVAGIDMRQRVYSDHPVYTRAPGPLGHGRSSHCWCRLGRPCVSLR